MSIEELKELYINKNENVEWETHVWCKSIFGDKMDANFGPIGISVLCDLIKLLGNTENYDKFSIEQIENLIDNEHEIKELLKNTNEKEYSKLKELFSANDFVKKKTYECIKEKLLEYKLNQWRNNLNKNIVKADLIDGQLLINKLNNNDIIKIKMFGKEKEIEVFSTGDNKYDESGNLKTNKNFQLTNEEIDMLNWFINNVKIEDYKKEIVDYCNEEYSSWQYSDGTTEGPIGIDDVENEINIFAIAINIMKNGYEDIPEISFYGECNCDEEHGICIGFKNKKFLGINSQDWTL